MSGQRHPRASLPSSPPARPHHNVSEWQRPAASASAVAAGRGRSRRRGHRVPELWLARVDEEAEKIAPGPIPLRAEIIPPDQLDLMRARSPSARQTHALNDVDAYGT